MLRDPFVRTKFLVWQQEAVESSRNVFHTAEKQDHKRLEEHRLVYNTCLEISQPTDQPTDLSINYCH